MALSELAIKALGRLDDGAVLNSIHSTARELILAGMAYDDWGHLALTEEGRRVARQFYRANSEQMSELWQTPADSHHVEQFELLPVGEQDHHVQEVIVRPVVSEGQLAWTRERAMWAAVLANNATDIWIEEKWLAAFMDAYEGG